jgi:myo-inositol-1(or 4)-monophosphatase
MSAAAEIPSEDLLREIEAMAVELARLAGAEIMTALGSILTIRYKSPSREAQASFQDPVSEVDHHVESLIRTRLAERFPEHDILGEEIDERPGRNHDFVWAVDPIDGTTNFINGFPLFAGSIGVLHENRPVAGALWCSTSHKLRAGVYHARSGGRLHFDEEPIEIKANPAIRQRLAGEPNFSSGALPWDVRKTGSAAIECAFVAAGLLRVARFARPNVWDVAGGLALVKAGGGVARTFVGGAWRPFEAFEASNPEASGPFDLAHWRQPLIIGEPEAVDLLCQQHSGGKS